MDDHFSTENHGFGIPPFQETSKCSNRHFGGQANQSLAHVVESEQEELQGSLAGSQDQGLKPGKLEIFKCLESLTKM